MPTCASVFIELYAMQKSTCTYHFKRSLQPSQRDYWLTQRNKICLPCFERRELACNYKLSLSLAIFLRLTASSQCLQPSECRTDSWSSEKKICWHALDNQKPFWVHVHIKEFSFIHLSLDYLIALNLKETELIFFIGVVLGEFSWPKY